MALLYPSGRTISNVGGSACLAQERVRANQRVESDLRRQPLGGSAISAGFKKSQKERLRCRLAASAYRRAPKRNLRTSEV